jgi:hypothetical protein
MYFSQDFEERMNFWNGLLPMRPMVPSLGGYVLGRWDSSGAGSLYAAYRGIQYGRVEERFQEASLVEDYPRVLYAEEEGPNCPQEMTLQQCIFNEENKVKGRKKFLKIFDIKEAQYLERKYSKI